MKRYIILAVMALISAVSCVQEKIEDIDLVPAGALLGDVEPAYCDDLTKAYFGNDFSFKWKENDQISILLTDGNRVTYELSTGAGSSKGTFAGNLEDGQVLSDKIAFPKVSVKAFSSENVTMELPAAYSYGEPFSLGSEGDDSIILPCRAQIEGNKFTMKHLGGYFIFEIRNIPAGADKFVFTVTNGKRINGTFTADLTAEMPQFAEQATENSDEQCVTITFAALETTTTRCFVIPVPVGEYSYEWRLYAGDTKKGFGEQESAVSVARGQIKGKRTSCSSIGDESIVPPNNEIWYKTIDDQPIDLYEYTQDPYGSKIVSHTYKNGYGRIVFDDDLKVVKDGAFAGTYTGLSVIELRLPDSVEELENGALSGLRCLKELYIPKNLKKVGGGGAFRNNHDKLPRFVGHHVSDDGRCVIIDDVLYGFAPDGLTEYTIPEGVKEIASYSFAWCKELRKITFNEGLENLGSSVFLECPFEEITLPNSLVSADSYAFRECPNIKAFYGNPNFISEDNLCFWVIDPNFGDKRLAYFAGIDLTEYVIPEGVELLENYCFQFAKKLEKVTLPNSLQTVGSVAFYGCDNLMELYGKNTTSDHRGYIVDGELQFIVDKGLTSYTTPEEVLIVGYEAFGHKNSIEEVILSDNVINVGQLGYIFEFSPKLKSVTISARIKNLGYDPFLGCYSLETAYVRAPFPPVIIHNPIECYPNRKCDFEGSAIYVPQQSYELYKSDPGWAIYGDLLKPYDFGDLSEFMPEDYFSTDYSKNGEVQKLQSATVGNGIDLVFMGDGFIDKDMKEGGKYEQVMNAAMEKFFSIEPYRTFRDRFDVYAVKVVSLNDEWGENARHAIAENDNIAFRYASAIEGINQDHLYVNVIYNAPTDGSWYGRSYTAMYYNDGSYVSYNMEGVNNVLIHEAAGHGFAKLADEYVEFDQTFTDYSGLDQMHEMNWYQNVDYHNTPETVYWNRFMSDSRYVGQVGIYEGAYTYAYGAYRPTENSMMRYNDSPFNAPSREAIYKAIMRESEGQGWVYNYEDFVAYDAINRQVAASHVMKKSKSKREISEYEKHHKAPVIVKGTWRDAMKESK